jgi:hypothetical protein
VCLYSIVVLITTPFLVYSTIAKAHRSCTNPRPRRSCSFSHTVALAIPIDIQNNGVLISKAGFLADCHIVDAHSGQINTSEKRTHTRSKPNLRSLLSKYSHGLKCDLRVCVFGKPAAIDSPCSIAAQRNILGRVECTVHHYPLDVAPSNCAVSYTWGVCHSSPPDHSQWKTSQRTREHLSVPPPFVAERRRTSFVGRFHMRQSRR